MCNLFSSIYHIKYTHTKLCALVLQRSKIIVENESESLYDDLSIPGSFPYSIKHIYLASSSFRGKEGFSKRGELLRGKTKLELKKRLMLDMEYDIICC